MNDILEAIDFLVDLVCVMPPLESVNKAGVPHSLFITACLGSVLLLVVSVISSGVKVVFVEKTIVVTITICVGLIGFISMERSTLQGIFVVGYPAMVIALRGAEGLIIGLKYQPQARLWHLGAFLCVGLALYLVLRQFPTPLLNIAKGAWAVLGAFVASREWTGKVSQSGNSPFDSPFSKVALFLVFVSTMFYVQTSRFDQLLFQWVFPVGFALGFVVKKTEK